MSKFSAYFSDDGRQLAIGFPPEKLSCPTVTVELSTKWYGLYVVHPSSRVEKVSFEVLQEVKADPYGKPLEGPPFVDHVPNPAYVFAWADLRDLNVDELAYELLLGRWHSEVLENGLETKKTLPA